MDSRCACGGCGIGRGYFPQDVTGHERVSDSIDDVYNTRCNMRPPPDIVMRKGYLYSFYNVCFSVPRPWTTRANKDLWIELSLKALEYLEDTLTPNPADKSDEEAGSVEAFHHHLQYACQTLQSHWLSTIKVHSPQVLVIHMTIALNNISSLNMQVCADRSLGLLVGIGNASQQCVDHAPRRDAESGLLLTWRQPPHRRKNMQVQLILHHSLYMCGADTFAPTHAETLGLAWCIVYELNV